MSTNRLAPLPSGKAVCRQPKAISLCHQCQALSLWVLSLLISTLPVRALAQFNYTTNSAGVTITGYRGSGGAVTIPATIDGLPVLNVGDFAFQGCSSLTNVLLPNNLTKIGIFAFRGCANLASVNIPDSVTNLGMFAFYFCSGLTNVTLGSGLTRLETGTFASCSSLSTVALNEGLLSIGDSAFSQCTSLENVIFGSQLTTIGAGAFFGCYALSSVSMPDSVRTIGIAAFSSCYNLNSVTIGNGVTRIGTEAFSYCYNLSGLYFKGNPPVAGSGIFDSDSATVYHLSNTSGWGPTFAGLRTGLWNSEVPCTYIVTNATITITKYIGSGGSVVVPDQIDGLPVTFIGNSAFAGSAITSIDITRNVLSLGQQAFYNCFVLTQFYVSDQVTNIGSLALAACGSLTNVSVDALNPAFSSLQGVLFDKAQTILLQLPGGVMGNYDVPSNVTSIGSAAFYACSGLRSVSIPIGVTNIGDQAFLLCYALTNINVDGLNPNYSSVGGVLFDKNKSALLQYPGGINGAYAIPDGVSIVGKYAFSSCYGLTGLTMPESVSSIEAQAFAGCFLLPNLIIANGVTNIGDHAFSQCMSLTNVTLGNQVKTIGAGAFSYCYDLPGLIIPDSVVTIGDQAFYYCFSLGTVVIGDGVTKLGTEAFSSCYNLNAVTIGKSLASIGARAFYYCFSLSGIYFKGNAPTLGPSVFYADSAIVYYLSGTTGWGPSFGGLPTALWVQPAFVRQDSGLHIEKNGLSLSIVGTATAPALIETCTNLTVPIWSPLQIVIPVNGSLYFNDTDWTNHAARFYRLRSP